MFCKKRHKKKTFDIFSLYNLLFRCFHCNDMLRNDLVIFITWMILERVNYHFPLKIYILNRRNAQIPNKKSRINRVYSSLFFNQLEICWANELTLNPSRLPTTVVATRPVATCAEEDTPSLEHFTNAQELTSTPHVSLHVSFVDVIKCVKNGIFSLLSLKLAVSRLS